MTTNKFPIDLYRALWSAQRSVATLIKDAQGHNYKYVTLDQIYDKLYPALDKVGVFMHFPAIEMVGGVATAHLHLIHLETGQALQGRFQLVAHPPRRDANSAVGALTPQESGGLYTYVCRYALVAFFGMPQVGEDDDAAGVSRAQLEEREREMQRATVWRATLGRLKKKFSRQEEVLAYFQERLNREVPNLNALSPEEKELIINSLEGSEEA